MRGLTLAILSAALTIGIAFAQDPTTDQNSGAKPQPESAVPAPAAQQPAPPSNAAANPPATNGPTRIAPGSVIPVELAKTIDAKKAKTGDEVIAKVTMDMKSNNGDVLVTKDTKVVGHVTEAQARNKEQKESELGIAFDRTVTKSGEMQMPMSIQAIIAPPNANSNNGASGNDQSAASAPSSSPSSTPSSTHMGGGGTAPANTSPANTMPTASDAGTNTSANARPQITAKTEGIIGISNMKLAPAPSAAQGSLVSSDKNNVKLESGTMMLLRVNQ
ncbi:MAG TPA: hypothetical protein VIH89_04880 [Candidatus Sulfotelmatobacter sp.]